MEKEETRGLHLLKIYIRNSRDVYRLTEWLEKCIAKRIAKGQFVDKAYLSECSTMKQIVNMASKLVHQNEEDVHITKEDKQTARLWHSDTILENGKYLSRDYIK